MPVITTLADAIVLSSASGSDTVQGAINAAQSASLPLFIAAGIYTTTPLTVSSSLTVRAPKGAAILRSSNSNALQITIAASSGTISDVLFDGVVFDGENKPLNSGASGLVNFNQADRLVVQNCFIFRASAIGLYFNTCRGRVSANGFDTCQTAIFSTNGYGMQIEGNNLYNSLNNGIYVDREPAGASTLAYDATTISKNVIAQTTNASGGSGQYGNAILCYEAQFVRIIDNLIYSANYSAIRANFCTDVVISGNQVDGARETAIFVENPADFAPGWSNIVVTANTLNNVGGGITLVNTNAGSRRASVVGNAIYMSKQNQFTEYATPDTNPSSAYTRITYGAGIIVSADCVVTSNVVEQTAGPGIVVALSGTFNTSTGKNPDQNTVTANVAYNTLKYCQVGIGYNDNDSRGFAEISENIIVGASQAQIIKVQPTNLSGVPGNPNNQFGPFAIVSGSPDQGTTSNAVTTRFSYNRNKIVPSTAS